MKKYFILLCVAMGMTACMNDWDTEIVPTTIFTAENVGEPNTTIAAVRDKYKKQIAANAVSADAKVNDDLIFEGIVTANDISGNIYQAIYVQGINGDGTIDSAHGGIQIAIKGIGSLAAVFPVGQKIRVNLKGLYVSGYGKMPRVGQPYVNANGAVRHGPMPAGYVKTNIQLVGTPTTMVQAHELTRADLAGSIDDITPMLVVMHGCKIKDAGDKYAYVRYEDQIGTYTVEHDVQLADGGTVQMVTSASATFAQDVMPGGKLTIYGVLARYSSSYQLILRSVDDVIVEK